VTDFQVVAGEEVDHQADHSLKREDTVVLSFPADLCPSRRPYWERTGENSVLPVRAEREAMIHPLASTYHSDTLRTCLLDG
jgi:hypothetical protein